MPDTHKKPSQSSKEVFVRADGSAHWRGSDKTRAAYQRTVLEHARQAEEEEKERLLYVALTRAERWLVVAAAGAADKNAESWHDRVKATLETVGGVTHPFEFADDGPDEGLRLDHMNWPNAITDEIDDTPVPEPALPPIFETPAPPPIAAPKTLSPSDLGGAKALSGADVDLNDIAKERGTLIHLLLETLPTLAQEDRESAAHSLMADHPKAPDLIAEAIIFIIFCSDPMNFRLNYG